MVSILLYLNYILIIWLPINIIITTIILSINWNLINNLFLHLFLNYNRLLSSTNGRLSDFYILILSAEIYSFHGCMSFLVLDVEVV